MTLAHIILDLTNAVRWWGVIAGIIGIADLWRMYHGDPPHIPLRSTFLIKCGVCTFLIVAGGVLPLMGSMGWVASDQITYTIPLLIAWWLLGIGAWASAAHFAHCQTMMRGASWLAMLGTISASFLVGVA
jgi:hypothetical protein